MMANLRHEMFLEKERAEQEALAREFEEDLEQLFATIKARDGQRSSQLAGSLISEPRWKS
jgi:hypothetical protein